MLCHLFYSVLGTGPPRGSLRKALPLTPSFGDLVPHIPHCCRHTFRPVLSTRSKKSDSGCRAIFCFLLLKETYKPSCVTHTSNLFIYFSANPKKFPSQYCMKVDFDIAHSFSSSPLSSLLFDPPAATVPASFSEGCSNRKCQIPLLHNNFMSLCVAPDHEAFYASHRLA